MKILVIEDDADIASNIGQYFEEKGHLLDFAYNGAHGLSMATAERFDLIILDLRMPRMDGRECLQRIRKTGATVPVIIASGLIQPEDMPILEEAGITAIIHKPYRIQEIADVVDRALAT